MTEFSKSIQFEIGNSSFRKPQANYQQHHNEVCFVHVTNMLYGHSRTQRTLLFIAYAYIYISRLVTKRTRMY